LSNNKYFSDFVGQQVVKETLGIYLDAHKNGKVIPHILTNAPKGVGKTVFCRKMQDYMAETRPEIIEVNGSHMKSPKQVTEGLFSEIQGIEASIFIDEVHAMPRSVANLFLTVLNPEPSHKTSLHYDGLTYEFDFKNKLTFLFATTERQLIFPPLLDRMEEVSFDDYKPSELTQILKRNCHGIILEDDTLNELAKYSRGNARWAAKTGEKLESFCAAKGITDFTPAEIGWFNRSMGIYEYGLMKQEVNVLRILSEYPQGATLKVMCARTGNTPTAQQDTEKYPQKHGLMDIDGKRKLTQKGKEFISRLK
jgi:Holliday junction resolvasome RuvABC ATP-dependent DNA helicase subunit